MVKFLVEMLEPYRGRVYDPCCGSSGMFVQSVEFIRAHASGNGGKAKADISICGQEYYTTWRLAKMNLAIRGIEGQIAHGDTFHDDKFPDLPDLKADFILANPPFNVSDWGGERLRDDKRWQYGVPPVGNANFAWVQHIIHHLAPAGVAGFVLANGSMSSNQSGEGEIRKNIIAGTYHAWRGEKEAGEYQDVPGFCKSATLEEIRKHGHVLTPGRYVGAERQEDDDEPFEEKMKRLTATLAEQFAESARLEKEIWANLRSIGYHVEKGGLE
ncbi:N-6 DNA methylase [Calidithermus timidus]|uniref:N-6 DNA methylase n=1 Tax=Calidithermus timidus TaxID=307124 RepID=UPI0003A022AB|nr:N-6 DNA methylase [Calidithermus timidus]